MEYLIFNEMSMVGRKFLGQVDKRLRQMIELTHGLEDVLTLLRLWTASSCDGSPVLYHRVTFSFG